MMKTVRQQMMDMLSRKEMDIVALSQALGINEKEAKNHLPHIARSVSARGGEFQVRPAVCEDCGYEFRDRKRLSPPSRCPKCKKLRIFGPWYQVTAPPPK